MEEQWKYVEGYDGIYSVSSFGRIYSHRKEKILSPRRHLKKNKYVPYYVVDFSVDGVEKHFTVHKLVLTTFVGPRQPGQECRHLDGNSLNNRLENLEWGTLKGNRDDRRRHMKGMVLTAENVRYIRTSGKSLRALAAELGCSKSTVQYARGGYWGDVPPATPVFNSDGSTS